jgi:hypothetical protein
MSSRPSVLRFQSSQTRVPHHDANFGIGTLAGTTRQGAHRRHQVAHLTLGDVAGDEHQPAGVVLIRPGRSRPPTFVFIDPFGFKIPFSYVAEVLRAQSCEVLITFMFEEINRFLAQDQQPDNFDDLFGCRDWREAINIKLPSERVKFLHDLYQRQLMQAAGANFVRSFAMRNERNAMDYFLFFATNNELGLRKMKEAMWRIDESGTYTFSDATDPDQSVLFSAEPDRQTLTRLIVDKFAGVETTPNEIERFVVRHTPFRETHYKKVLQALEEADKIVPVNPPAKRRCGTYADINMRLSFKSKPHS